MDMEKIKTMLDQIIEDAEKVKKVIFGNNYKTIAKTLSTAESQNVVEGVFNGELMVDKDGKEYVVPANYASKSKLVSGDILKLTIALDGSFIFKQIKPIERKKIIGTLILDNLDNYSVETESGNYKVLPASVSYFKGREGDKLTIIVPQSQPSIWAAIENKLEPKE